MNKKIVIAVFILAAALLLLDQLGVPLPGRDSAAERLVAKNVAVRGGSEAWAKVKTLRLSGSMGLGQGLTAPYTLEQQRPDKMRLEFEFNGARSVQTVDGVQGWKLAPFRGASEPEPMNEIELRETAASGSPGLLFDYKSQGHQIELQGDTTVDGKETQKLKVTLANGAVRWLYLEEETGLELKLEAMRTIAGRDQLVETYYREWRNAGDLKIPSRQESRIQGTEAWNELTVEKIEINPSLNLDRFAKPETAISSGA